MRLQVMLPVFLLLLFSSCHNANPENDFAASADSTTFSGDVSAITSASRKITKQANLKCRVKNISQTVSAIEGAVQSLGGFVSVSETSNQYAKKQVLRYKRDSLKEVNVYHPVATMYLRVPFQYLDSILRIIPSVVDFTVYRNIRQDDMTLAYLSNSLKNKANGNIAKYSSQPDTILGNDIVIDRRIQNLQILDDVHYAKLSVVLEQHDQLYTTIIPDPDYAVSLPFITMAGNNFIAGWNMIKTFLGAIIVMWPFLLITGIPLWLYKTKKLKIFKAARPQQTR